MAIIDLGVANELKSEQAKSLKAYIMDNYHLDTTSQRLVINNIDYAWNKFTDVESAVDYLTKIFDALGMTDITNELLLGMYYDGSRFTDPDEMRDFVIALYSLSDQEFTSLCMDFQVEMSRKDILDVYTDLMSEINGDVVIHGELVKQIDDNHVVIKEIEGFHNNTVFKGNCKDFLEAFNDRESETGWYRVIEDDDLCEEYNIGDDGTAGELLQFVW